MLFIIVIYFIYNETHFSLVLITTIYHFVSVINYNYLYSC